MKPALAASISLFSIGLAFAVSADEGADLDLGPLVTAEAKVVAPDTKRIGEFFTSDKEVMDWFVEMKRGNCYFIVGVGEKRVKELNLYLWNSKDERMTENTRAGSKVSIVHCPWESGMFRFQAKINRGKGMYMVGVYAKEGTPEEPPVKKGGLFGTGLKFGKKDKAPEAPEPTADLSSIVEAEAKSVAPGAKRVGEFYSSDKDVMDWFVEMKAGKCYWVVGAGEKKLKELNLYLWSPKDKRITENRHAGPKVSMAHCAEESGMYRFQAKINKGKGAYSVGVYAKAAE